MSADPRRVLVAMSGGVDSSVAAGLLARAGHEVVGATMKLWGGASDRGCCSVADVEDARRVAEGLGIEHHVFNFTADFEARVVGPYVSDHVAGRTPNPCIECNRHLKFDRFLERALLLGFDAIATGHHARVDLHAGRFRLRRGRDAAKDQSYVLSMLGQEQLARCMFPVGDLTKADVRRLAADWGLRTAAKADSQDVCFIGSQGGRRSFLAQRAALSPGVVLDGAGGPVVGRVDAVQLVTVGQRRGLGPGGSAGGARRFALDVDVRAGVVTLGSPEELAVRRALLRDMTWVDEPVPPGTRVLAQTSAHCAAMPAVLEEAALAWEQPHRRVAPGQTIALYDADCVLGAGIAC